MTAKPQKNTDSSKPHAIVTVERSWSGPLPPPEILERFEVIVPGSAKQIMDSFHGQTQHRQLENKISDSNILKEKRGQWFGLIIAIFFGFCSTTCIIKGHDAAGEVLGGTTLVTLVAVFVLGKVKQIGSLKRKDKIKPV